MSEAKADAGKLELDLVPVQIVRDIAQVRMYGTAKCHDPENWRKVELRRYINALLRHTLAFIEDPDSVDDESGIPHYKHMACNMAFICELMKDRHVVRISAYEYFNRYITCIDKPPEACGNCPYLIDKKCWCPDAVKTAHIRANMEVNRK